MDRVVLEEHLAEAVRHVAEGSKRVDRQELLVLELARDGHDTRVAEQLLVALRQAQRLHEEHLATIRVEIIDADHARDQKTGSAAPR